MKNPWFRLKSDFSGQIWQNFAPKKKKKRKKKADIFYSNYHVFWLCLIGNQLPI
jgi:hypothetical protein